MKKNIFIATAIIFMLFESIDLHATYFCQWYIDVETEINLDNCCLQVTITNNNDGLHGCSDYPVFIQQWNADGSSSVVAQTTLNQGESYSYCIPLLPEMSSIEWNAYWGDVGEYYYYQNTQTKKTVDMSSCCSCPEGRDNWLTFDVQYNDPDCGPGQCKVTPVVTIPDDVTCFTHYAGLESGDSDFSSVIPVGTDLPYYCVSKGETIDYTVALLKDQNSNPMDYYLYGADFCVIEGVVSPECDKPESVPCVPDCPSDEFAPPITNTFLVDQACPGCSVTVTYTFRTACPEQFQDLQILEIEWPDGSACDNCFIEDIFESVAAGIIALSNEAPMNFEPENVPDCSQQWRIAHAGCWGKEHLYYISNGNGILQEVVNWHACPCDAGDCGCCYQKLEVCRTAYRTVDITPIGSPYNQGVCTDSIVGDDGQSFECIPSCSWAGQIDGEYGPIEDGIGTGGSGKLASDYGRLLHKIKYTHINDILEISLHTANASTAKIKIYDLAGNFIESKTYSVSTGMNYLRLNTSTYNSGTYIYTLTIDGNELNSDKFNVVR